MARIDSLNVLLSTTGNDYLAEQYGAVIDNIQKATISGTIKNTALSGNPSAGTVEAKRFENRTSQTYGAARSGLAGASVKVTPVVIPINVDKELITEVEEKDVALYGVDNFIGRQAEIDRKSMVRELERAFFTEASTGGEAFSTDEATIDGQIEALIQEIENTQNDFVDGVDRDMISIALSTAKYGELRKYLDNDTNNANVDTGAKEFGLFHGVRVFSTVYLPTGVEAVAMVDGAIAQPVRTTVAPAQKIPLTNAYAFGLFYSYGTKAVMPELIQYVTTGASA